MRALDEHHFFEDVYARLARDSAGMLEVAICLHRSLETLGQLNYRPYQEAAREQAARALKLSDASLTLPSDQQRLVEIAHWRTAP